MLSTMLPQPNVPLPDRRETCFAVLVFALCLALNGWGVQVGWRSLNLPGHEFRQAQTALSAFHIQQDRDFSLDYPTPVLGKPWSIPLEFPLYQWAVVAVSDGTGWGLIASGRLVSLTCFYLMLPAVFLLLGSLGVAPGRRWLVLAIVVTSPLYIFYARAFMIETMALMFSLWFWAAFERSVVRADWRWLILANLAGTGAGLVKVTTLFVYTLPAAGWALRRLWLARRDNRWQRDMVWMALAVVFPLGVTFWWGHHADEVRQLNPLAHFLVSKDFYGFNFGTWTTRLSPELWLQKWQTMTQSVTWWPVLAATLGLAFLSLRGRITISAMATCLFAAPLMIFPVLYGFHDYYFVANGVLLLTAVGLIIVGVAESTRWVWLPAVLTLALAGGQIYRYTGDYYQTQKGLSDGGDGLTQSLRALLKPDEVIVVVGQQWNPMLPFYAQRRAMMIREVDERNPARLDAAFAALAGEKIGALVISSSVQVPAEFLRRSAEFGIGKQAIYRWGDATIYLRDDSRDASVRRMQQTSYSGVTWVPGVEPQTERLAGYWVEIARLPAEKQIYFSGMTPRPVRFFSSFGPAISFDDGRQDFGAHPVTRLVFALPAGDHVLRTTAMIPAEMYDPELGNQATDGVEITLTALARNGAGRKLFTRVVNPRDNPADRDPCPLEVHFNLEQAGEVELLFGPGPAGRDTRDTILIGPLEIQ